jgi:hypothetical protein
VDAAFKRQGLPLQNRERSSFNSVPHVYPLTFNPAAYVTPSGLPRGGLHFQVFVFRSVAAAKRALSSSYIAQLHYARTPWRRLSNVVLISAMAVIPANHDRGIWKKAVVALNSLAH